MYQLQFFCWGKCVLYFIINTMNLWSYPVFAIRCIYCYTNGTLDGVLGKMFRILTPFGTHGRVIVYSWPANIMFLFSFICIWTFCFTTVWFNFNSRLHNVRQWSEDDGGGGDMGFQATVGISRTIRLNPCRLQRRFGKYMEISLYLQQEWRRYYFVTLLSFRVIIITIIITFKA